MGRIFRSCLLILNASSICQRSRYLSSSSLGVLSLALEMMLRDTEGLSSSEKRFRDHHFRATGESVHQFRCVIRNVYSPARHSDQRGHSRRRATKKRRSAICNVGRFTLRWRTSICCRRAKFSKARSSLDRRIVRENQTKSLRSRLIIERFSAYIDIGSIFWSPKDR